MKTLKSQVAYILELYPETRSSDIELAIKVWTEFYGKLMYRVLPRSEKLNTFDSIYHSSLREHPSIDLYDLHKLPSYDNICRYRRLLTPLFPATEEVTRHRRRFTKERKEEFGKSIVEQTKDIT